MSRERSDRASHGRPAVLQSAALEMRKDTGQRPAEGAAERLRVLAWVAASDARFVATVIVGVLLLTSLPYAYGYLSMPPDRQFMGLALNVPDHAQYFAWMRDLARAPLAANRLTPEANAPIFFNLLWWMLGRLGKALGWGYAGVYQILRLGGGTLFLLAAYRICAWFLDDRLQRRTAFALVAVGGGLGWVLVVLKYTLTQGELLLPLTVYIAEPNTFLSILGYPHFAAAALYVCVYDILRVRSRAPWRAIGAGLLALWLGWQHAYDLLLVWGVLGAHLGLLWLRDRRLPRLPLRDLAIVVGLSCWPALYSVALTARDPLWREVLAQFANAGVYTPPPIQLPILLGLPLLLAIYRLATEVRCGLGVADDHRLFLWGWFGATAVLVYLPVDYQVHMLNGWQIPIAILATRAVLEDLGPQLLSGLKRLRRRGSPQLWRQWVAVALVLACLPTNAYLLAWRFVDLGRHNHPYYLHLDELRALEWLEAHAGPDDVVLASLTLGQYVPVFSDARAFLAHWAQTVDFYEKQRLVEAFYSGGMSEDERADLLAHYGVRYVLYGPAERELGGYANDGWEPGQSALVVRVDDFIGREATVYRVGSPTMAKPSAP